MKCPVCLGKRFVWVNSARKVVGPTITPSYVEPCFYCNGAGEVSCCDGGAVCGEKDAP